MNVRLVGDRIEAAIWLVVPERMPEWDPLTEIAPAWDTHEHGIYAYSDEERDEIVAVLRAKGVKATIEAADQPDAELLAKLQGRVSTRSEALAALGSGKVPPIIDDITDLDDRVKELESTSEIAR